eukprot:SAG11_NODE_25758_length_354_cov_1.015686_1_plen_36_part_10
MSTYTEGEWLLVVHEWLLTVPVAATSLTLTKEKTSL